MTATMTMSKYQVQRDDLSAKQEVRALLELHMQGMLDSSPAAEVLRSICQDCKRLM